MADTGGATELICPKCGAAMRSYDRNGVTVEQCSGCRGIFLDRGELERLTDAEAGHYAESGYRGDRDEDSGYRGDRDEDRYARDEHGSRRRRRGGFLGSLFEGGGD